MSSPIFFDKFGKSTKDIFKKKFDYVNSVKFGIKNPAKDDMNVNTTISFKDSAVFGKAVITGQIVNNTNFEIEANTSGKSVAKATYKCDSGNCDVNLKHTINDPKTKKGALTHELNVDYKIKKNVAGSVNVSMGANETMPKVGASAVANYKGINLGAFAAYSFEAKAVSEYNLGVDYAKNNYQITAKCANKGESLVVSYFQKVSDRHKAAVRLNFENNFNDRCFEVANEFDMDDKTTAVVALDSNGTIAANLEHSYETFKVSTCTSLNNGDKKLGLGLTFF